MKKRKLKPRTYSIVSDAVETGIGFGINRWQKYRIVQELEQPDLDALREQLAHEITLALEEVINFD